MDDNDDDDDANDDDDNDELFHAFSLDHFYGSITHTTGRIAYTIVQGNCLFKVMGRATSQQAAKAFRRTRLSMSVSVPSCSCIVTGNKGC